MKEFPILGLQSGHLVPLFELSTMVPNAPDVLQMPVVEAVNPLLSDLDLGSEGGNEAVNLRLLLGNLCCFSPVSTWGDNLGLQ